jgi:hypothetical protein
VLRNSLTENGRQNFALRMFCKTIFSVWVDIFYPPIFGYFEKNGVFQPSLKIPGLHIRNLVRKGLGQGPRAARSSASAA